MNTLNKYLVLLVAIFLLPQWANAAKKERVYMSVEYANYVQDNKLLKVSVREKIDKKFNPISNLPINILIETVSGDSLLTQVVTDLEGIAWASFSSDYSFYSDEKGKVVLKAEFEGSDTHKKASKSIKFKPVEINTKVDSKNRSVLLSLDSPIGDSTLLEEEVSVDVYVNRMFQPIKVGEVPIKDGQGEYKFVEQIPGNKEGNLELLFVVEDRTFQKVVSKQIVNWGIPQKEKEKKKENAALSYLIFMFGSIGLTLLLAYFLHSKFKKKEV